MPIAIQLNVTPLVNCDVPFQNLKVADVVVIPSVVACNPEPPAFKVATTAGRSVNSLVNCIVVEDELATATPQSIFKEFELFKISSKLLFNVDIN